MEKQFYISFIPSVSIIYIHTHTWPSKKYMYATFIIHTWKQLLNKNWIKHIICRCYFNRQKYYSYLHLINLVLKKRKNQRDRCDWLLEGTFDFVLPYDSKKYRIVLNYVNYTVMNVDY